MLVSMDSGGRDAATAKQSAGLGPDDAGLGRDDKAGLGFDDVAAAGLSDWRMLLSTLHARFVTDDFASAFGLVERITAAAEEANHHPDIDLRWGAVGVALTSHDVGALTQRDLRLAKRISAIAADLGAEPRPQEIATLEVALDTADHSRVRDFWRVLLGAGEKHADDEVTDPRGQVPTLWFQPTEPHEEPKQRFHLDVWVPADVAEQRVAAAIAAGGRLVTDEAAPAFWVLADADGNRACVCTAQRARSAE